MASFFRFSGVFTKNLNAQASKLARAKMIEVGESQREILKEKLLNAVRLHPICQELDSLTLPSRFVYSESGTATLYGYLGFPAGSDPVSDLIDFLDETISVNSRRKYFSVGDKIVVSLVLPKKSQLSSDPRLKLPWSGTGWPILIENGVSGLSGASHFLQADSPKSRSNLGIQIKGVTRPDLPPLDFLSEIFRDFRAKFGGKV